MIKELPNNKGLQGAAVFNRRASVGRLKSAGPWGSILFVVSFAG